MAIIHRTTLTPTKLELLTAWLPGRPWYTGGPDAPVLTKAGGFRLDDPERAVIVRRGLISVESQHRGDQIHKSMRQRAGYRHRRRSANCRYRARRSQNRTAAQGWLLHPCGTASTPLSPSLPACAATRPSPRFTWRASPSTPTP